MSVSLAELITPCCLLDLPKFKANIARVEARCQTAGIPLRAHVKTLKSLEAARYYAPLGTPITVSTLAEAEYFSVAGYRDILYAVGITSNKLEKVGQLQRAGVNITVCLDSLEGFAAIAGRLATLPQPLSIAIEIDADGCRAGIAPTAPELRLLAERLAAHPQVIFWGIMTHAGGSYACTTKEQQYLMAEQEVRAAQEAAARIRALGIAVSHVSIGSTPTVLQPVALAGITELRAGVFATFDCVMAELGVCAYEDIALSVLTRVIGRQKETGSVLVDAGWMALSRDVCASAAAAQQTCYGLVANSEGQPLPGWYVEKTNQEHGIIRHLDGARADISLFPHDSMVRILPVHACATASQFDHYSVIDEKQQIVSQWQRMRGW